MIQREIQLTGKTLITYNYFIKHGNNLLFSFRINQGHHTLLDFYFSQSYYTNEHSTKILIKKKKYLLHFVAQF